MGEKIFAFDIGTRSVVGIILAKQNDDFEVIDLVTEEHQKRSMLDGQIHDIVAVSDVIKRVKERLEQKHGRISKVCVAAAGRALKTQQTEVSTDIRQHPIMSEDDVFRLELSAVQEAQFELARQEQAEKTTHYYCVGYSVLHYQLDDDEIGSLVDQQGTTAKVKIIATFLPKVVVESLISALQRADLEMDALTLEPIAAINVLIPPSMRRLNVALVDVGAGTSDIAITNHGTVTAYGMVPIAGDEITDSISQAYLLDFPKAEDVKRDITKYKKAAVEDILGFDAEIHYEELVHEISGSIDYLAQSICEEIFTLNQKAPQAVMLVGGGSLTPELTNRIAHYLKLPANRVAIRGTEAIQNLKMGQDFPVGPAFVTPVGIAIAAKQAPIQYISVTVNGRPIRLFDLKELTIGDCLLAAGIKISKLYGKPGMAIMVTINGRSLSIPGTLGKPPLIRLNGEYATLNTPIQHGDELIVQAGEEGKSPDVTVKDVVEGHEAKTIYFQEHPYTMKAEVTLNDKLVDQYDKIRDGDRIDIHTVKTIEEFLKRINEGGYLQKLKPFTVQINGQLYTTQQQVCTLYMNNQSATLDSYLHHRDQLTIELKEEMNLEEFLEHAGLTLYEQMPVTFDSKEIQLQKPKRLFYKNGKKLTENSLISYGDRLTMKEYDSEPFIFQDIFRYIDIDISSAKGKQFKLYKNQQEATFIDPLSPHDCVEIRWIQIQSDRA
ncbi:cell division protein FtsA [Salinibacillus kushneri]|uniref:Cell division protein FtsA n=1 Tax=Salinibacillus kushneri TaxID=237682 RepID=A0A1I0JEF7_9BACI|nr:cell division protein FtsA [Salinibacillus kushneri]SEU07630.1 cell division protein FtsA [Salinibacillus kushneri]